MYKIMIRTLDSDDEGFEIAGDFETEATAWAAWDDESDEWPKMVGVWVEKVSGSEEFFQGWEEYEAIEAWDGLQ